MAMTAKQLLIFLISLTLTTTSMTIHLKSDVHDVLEQYGLPRGLLPDVVKSYDLANDGSFTIELSTTCYVQFTDLVYYRKTITGKLSYGKISDISGIQVKKLFAWLSVTGIDADGGSLYFHAGFVSEGLPASVFDQIPSCKSHLGDISGESRAQIA